MKRSRGLTLVEILAVSAIVGVLLAILLPVLARGKEAGQKAESLSNLRQLTIAMLLYSHENEGRVAMDNGMQSGYWLAEIGLVRGGTPAVRDPRYLPSSPGLYPTAAGYGVNSCFYPGISPSRLDGAPANVVLFTTTSDSMYKGIDRDFSPSIDAVMPDGLYAARINAEAVREVMITNGVWGSRRYGGLGLYGFADGHVGAHSEGEFRVPMTDRPCFTKATSTFTAPSGAPTFEATNP